MALGNKEVMAKNIKKQMEIHNVNASTICADLKIPMATFSDWCHAKTYPRIDKIEMLANYFDISKSELVEINLNTPLTRKEFLENPMKIFAGIGTMNYDEILAEQKPKPTNRQEAISMLPADTIEKLNRLDPNQVDTLIDMIDVFYQKKIGQD